MPNAFDTSPETLINKTSEELKKIIKAPEWSNFVKTSAGKERPPVEDDWWYKRAASIMRKIYTHEPVGVSKLRRKYTAKKNRGHMTERTYPGSGKIVRAILQQLEGAELLKKSDRKLRPGRVLTPKGRSMMDKIGKWQTNTSQGK